MATRKHKPTESGQAKHATSLHEAAVTLGHAGGKVGGPARAVKLTEAERHRIAKMGGQARGRQEGHTAGKGQSTVAKKAASPSGQATRANPVQPAVGGYAGPGRDEEVEYGQESPHLDMVSQIARHLNTPRAAKTQAPHDPSVGQAVQGYFDQATAAMGRGGQTGKGKPVPLAAGPKIGNRPLH